MTTPPTGQVAWITGVGSGIGLAGAIELVKGAAHGVISGSNATTNANALSMLQALGSLGLSGEGWFDGPAHGVCAVLPRAAGALPFADRPYGLVTEGGAGLGGLLRNEHLRSQRRDRRAP
jgi:NAD(P)-dependent dehydrogenase (short-subunit alcohol dehydrogenase family)